MRLKGIIISIERRLLRLINKVKSSEELSAIERRTTKYETANSEVILPVVRRIILPRKVLMQAYTIKQTRGNNSVILRGTNR